MPTPTTVALLPPGEKQLKMLDMELPDPGPTEVVVQFYASGICHSQLHQIHGERTNPVLLGHEASGKIVATGGQVDYVQPGDEVLVTWVPRAADQDARPATWMQVPLPGGETATCQNIFTWSLHGLMDEQYVVKAKQGFDRELGSIVGCAVMTGAGAVTNTADVQPGDSVAVVGVGGVGLSAVAAAAQRGADPIIAVDLDQDKLQMAKRFGATELIDASKEDAVQKIHALTARPDAFSFLQAPVSGVDFAFDCIGASATTAQILQAVRTGQFGVQGGGTAVLVGIPQQPHEVDALNLVVTEKRFVGSMAGTSKPERDFPVLLDWHEQGHLDLDQLVTERFPLERANEAVAALEAGEISGRAIFVY